MVATAELHWNLRSTRRRGLFGIRRRKRWGRRRRTSAFI